MKILVTGGAGFIGSNLTDRLLKEGHSVVVFDNLYLGKYEFIARHTNNPNFNFVQEDLLNIDKVIEVSKGCDLVFHLAANSDISLGRQETDLDFRLGTLTTYNVIEAMRLNNIKDIIFASTSAVYGEKGTTILSEDHGPLNPISLYGASKLAAEGFISAFCHNFNINAWVYRFGNVVGPNSTHGIIFDFLKKLTKDPHNLEILGDGTQAKPYIYVTDCINGMLWGYTHSKKQHNTFNLSTQGATSVRDIADIVTRCAGHSNVNYCFTGGTRGWIGDVPQVRLDNRKILSIGWQPQYSSYQAVEMAAKKIIEAQS